MVDVPWALRLMISSPARIGNVVDAIVGVIEPSSSEEEEVQRHDSLLIVVVWTGILLMVAGWKAWLVFDDSDNTAAARMVAINRFIFLAGLLSLFY